VIVADTSAIIALIDAREDYHEQIAELYERTANEWVLPAATLPEIDYLIAKRLGEPVQIAFVRDLAEARYSVEWGEARDLVRARELLERYRSLRMGLVDALVIALAERLRARAIVTLDVRHLGAVKIKGEPRMLPRDM
jgi:predicted nucleic acid-binding protein